MAYRNFFYLFHLIDPTQRLIIYCAIEFIVNTYTIAHLYVMFKQLYSVPTQTTTVVTIKKTEIQVIWNVSVYLSVFIILFYRVNFTLYYLHCCTRVELFSKGCSGPSLTTILPPYNIVHYTYRWSCIKFTARLPL